MTFDEFVKKHVGKAMDYDGVAGVQCVDLAKYYVDEVFGIKAGAWGDAHYWYDGFNNIPALKNTFTRIPNTPDFVPQKGDIAVWGSSLSSGGWGHIAVCTGEGDTSWFNSYDQNWTGNHDACAKIRHNYRAFSGVLRPKEQSKVLGVLPTLDTSGWKKGSKALGVYGMKQRLIALGYSKLDDSQGFGGGTENAVNDVLSKNGYRANGIAGKGFLKLIAK